MVAAIIATTPSHLKRRIITLRGRGARFIFHPIQETETGPSREPRLTSLRSGSALRVNHNGRVFANAE